MTENEALNKHIKDCGHCRDKACEYGHQCLQKKDIEVYKKLIEFEAIGTVEELKALKEKLDNAKEDIRKLLCSEYGSSCQFCIHDENEDAMCCNIGGSGSWCCENARWKEH